MKYSDVTVIIPTLNEARNIAELISIITGSYRGIKVVVADEGSTDGTGTIVRRIGKRNRNVRLLERHGKAVHGITASVIDAARMVETRLIVVMDGDLQHPPEKIREITGQLRQGSDIAIGTRVAVVGKWPLHRRLMSIIATNLARMRLLKHVSDPMSGFFGVKIELFRSVLASSEAHFVKEGYKVLFDLLKCAHNARLSKVMYKFGERKRGKSKIKARHVIYFLKSLFR